MTPCETCLYFCYNEETDDYECVMNMDEDEYFHALTSHCKGCPCYCINNEYIIVNKQI